MLRLAALALVLGGLAAAFCLVPVAGRTALVRFQAAPDAGTFLSSAWREWRGAAAGPVPKRARPAKRERSEKTAQRPEHEAESAAPLARAEGAPRSRSSAQSPPAAATTRPPAEEHRESDRAALDRLLSERSR